MLLNSQVKHSGQRRYPPSPPIWSYPLQHENISLHFRRFVTLESLKNMFVSNKQNVKIVVHGCFLMYFLIATTPHKNIETNSRFTRKIDISSHMESLNFQSGNDETA